MLTQIFATMLPEVMSQKSGLTKSFKYAFRGIVDAIKSEPNFRIHIIVAITVLVAGKLFGLETTQWLILFLVIYFVLMLEILNTILEKIVDMVSPEVNETARAAKDMAAAAVLLSAVVSVIVGVILFLPKIAGLLK